MNLKQNLNVKRGEVLGLDIGSCSVKIIALSKDDAGYKVSAAGITQIRDPGAATRDSHFESAGGADSRTRATAVAIRECLAQTKLRAKVKLRTNFAVCSVSGSEVAVRDFAFPPLAPEDVDGAVSLEAAQVCPFNADQAAVDYQLITDGTDKTTGILVAATNILVTNKIELAKKAGLKCVLMDIDGLALLNCFYGLGSNADKNEAAILNVGASYTTLAVMNTDGWPFIRETAYAGDNILDRISAANDISVEDLKSILFDECKDSESKNDSSQLAEQNSHPDAGELMVSLEKASEELVTGVSETLRFYAAQEKSVPIRKIYLCGGFARAEGFAELLNRKLGAEVILWNPFDDVRCEASQGCMDILKTDGHSLAVAAGLAMRSI
jgi:type IV pilus assembly protein PilM